MMGLTADGFFFCFFAWREIRCLFCDDIFVRVLMFHDVFGVREAVMLKNWRFTITRIMLSDFMLIALRGGC